MNFRCKIRHCHSIHRPLFPIRVQNFGDFATFSVDVCILCAECPPYFYFRFVWPTDLESIPHASTPTSIIATKFEDPKPISSWVMSYNVSHWLPLKMRTRPLRIRRITWPVSRGSKTITNPRPRFAYSLYSFYWATTTIKGRLLSNRPTLKPFSGEKNSKSRRNGAQKWRFWGEMGSKPYIFVLRAPKGTSLRGTSSFHVFCVKIIGARVSAVAFLKNPPPKKPSHFMPRGAKSCMRRTETPKPIWIKFCVVVDITDVVTHTNKFWWPSVKGFLGSGGSNFPIFHWLSSSFLQHSRTTMRACDYLVDD